ncbi:signal recognition particle-docking protein FtsY [Brachybacterium sp. DNPG3]
MDPNDILSLIAGGGGVVLILGAGAWAFLRGRGKGSSQGEGEESRGSTGEAGSTAPTATAVKDRPAAPTWADTLSAAEPPTETPSAPSVEEPVEGQAEEPAEESAEQETPSVGAPAATETTSATETSSATEADAAAEGETESAAATTDAAPSSAEAPSAPIADADAPAAEPTPPAPEPSAPAEAPVEPARTVDRPEAPENRMMRLRERLSRSGALGRGILTLLTRSSIDEDTWDEIEETLLLADLGPDATDELLESLRRRMQVLGNDDAGAVREALRDELLTLVDPSLDRRVAATARTAEDGTRVPSVVLMVGVNGTGKTTTVGKLARVLVAADRSVVLGAADTFRAAAAEQLATWGSRVGVDTVRSDRDGADPAAVAFDAVKEGIEQGVDVVIVDTAGRLQNKKGLMDELGKVRRVAEKGLHGEGVAEVLLVIDATTGQNGMQQARVFSEAVDVTGIVLTKLDGTAKGGIVVNVQRELGVPVKMVGLGEGMDDLAPFDPHGFVDALLGD